MNILITENESTTEEKYILLFSQLNSLLLPGDNLISNLANCTAAIKQTFPKISWAGFYISDGTRLHLGPFQGKVACTTIESGRGVCGAAAEKRETIIVKDVNAFPGHIYCDPESKSEIVVPVIKEGALFGVLDIDSTSYGSFDETDRTYLEKICTFLAEKII